ncbi:hypothetical protein LCGC14_1288300 [marine sediment metagenome]|uniref:Uncharacterized protein n=1 Tax=marine sediment metagenome TaxID=412755 RepID=A0A0F9NW58_9ZZZZ
MFNTKKKSIKVVTLILIGLFFFSGIPTATSTPITETSNKENVEIEDIDYVENEENTLPISYETTETEWRPIEESFNFNSENAESAVDPTTTASYNSFTGIESFMSTPESSMPSPSVIEEYEGMLAEAAGDDLSSFANNPEAVIGGDGRVRRTPTTGYPWRTVVKLYITAADTSTWIGSGAIVDDYHVLTAGHCIYLPSNGGWATSIRVVPAMDNLDEPYGEAWNIQLRSYTGWTVSNSPQHDWGLITLDRNIGSYTGWMGRITAGSGNAIYTQTMNVAGYPSDLDGGVNMYWDSDTGDGATLNNHYYWADTAEGMSGGPVWRYASGSRYIMTVHAYGRGGTDSNYGTRMNQAKYDDLFTWFGLEPTPTDYPDMKDRGSAYSGYNTGYVTPGVTSFTVFADIINKGTASTGTFVVRFYASTDTTIYTDDTYLGFDVVSSISPFNYRQASWTGTLPGLADGDYYIGWIIDYSPDNVNEFDDTLADNRAYISSPITVPRPATYIEVTVRDSVTSLPLSGVLVRAYELGTSNLADWGWTDASGLVNISGLDIGWYEVNVSKGGYVDQSKNNYINWIGDDDYLWFNLIPHPPNSGYIDVTVRDSDTLSLIMNSYVAAYYLNGTFYKGGYTDSSGFYRITDLGIGWWEVRASKITYIEQSSNDYINWNGDDDYLSFYLAPYPPYSGWIEVQVNDSITSNPIGGALVETFYFANETLFDSGLTNSSTGLYIVPDLPIGWFIVNVTKGGYTTQSKLDYINWRGDDDYLYYMMSVSSATEGVIEVEVYDSVSSLPILSAFVETFYQNGTLFDSGYTNVIGAYSVVDVPVGTYTVNVSKLTYTTQSQQDTISAGGEFDLLTFNLVTLPPDSGYIEVQVNDTNTLLPLQDAYVSCYYLNGTLFSYGYTDSSGFFKITGLTVGWWYVEASKVGYELKSGFDLINWIGDDDYLTFLLDTLSALPAHIEVQVNESGTLDPIQNAFVRIFYPNGTLFDSGYTDSSGLYIVNDLEVGGWAIIVTYPGYVQQSQDAYLSWWADTDILYYELSRAFNPIVGPVAIFRDLIPWSKNATEPVLVDYDIPYTVFNSSDVGVVDISSYQKVIIASDQPPSFYWAIGNNTAWFESYVSAGGFLQIHAADAGWETGDWSKSFFMPGGINKTQFYLELEVSVNMSEHPVLISPYPIEGGELYSWIGGYFTTYPSSANVILSEPSGKPVLIEFSYGLGNIVASTHTLEWNQFENLSKLLENLILYDPLLAYDTINVTSPISASSWEVPSTHIITWDSTGTISNVKIDLYENGVFVTEIVASTTNDGSYSWDVPIGLSTSTLYQIRVSDAIYPLTNDDSDNFEIQDLRSITVVVPDSSSSWIFDNIYDINWTSTGTIANVKIELYASAILIMEIVASTTNDGIYSWTIPDTLVNFSEYVIRISDVLDPTMYDDSDTFRISGPSSAIPGYDLLILSGLLGVVSLAIIKKKRKKLSMYES